MMESYTGFAYVYDMFMDDIPYEEWVEYLCTLLKEYGVESGTCTELGCGTGTVTELLAGRGYQMTGVDLSEEMLMIAADKRAESGSDILYLHQDMAQLELLEPEDCMVSICDSLNYIIEEEKLLYTFQNVFRFLKPGGVFIFDMKTEYFYREVLGTYNFVENREKASLIWENEYCREDRINLYELTVFAEEEEGLFRKYTETHFQKAYSFDIIKNMAEQAGFSCEAVYDAFTKAPPHKKSERVYFVLKRGKE